MCSRRDDSTSATALRSLLRVALAVLVKRLVGFITHAQTGYNQIDAMHVYASMYLELYQDNVHHFNTAWTATAWTVDRYSFSTAVYTLSRAVSEGLRRFLSCIEVCVICSEKWDPMMHDVLHNSLRLG